MYQAYLNNFNRQIAAVSAGQAERRADGRLPHIPVDPERLRDR